MYYLQSRYYDPSVGRFINADEPSTLFLNSGAPMGANLFAYCLNNPVMYTDSAGLAPEWLKNVGRFIGGFAITVVAGIATIATSPLFLVPGAAAIPEFLLGMTIYGGALMAAACDSDGNLQCGSGRQGKN